jgi:eukaryotic-like serine/threonine-protein kinase
MTAATELETSLIDNLLLQWQEAREQGSSCSAESLCAGHPELIEQVREQIDALEAMHALLLLDPLPQTHPMVQRGSPVDLPELPGYEVLALIDEGGMGTVYRARQPKLQREVAIKMVRAGRHARTEQLERFRAEAEAVARLRHPNIIQIYEVGEWRGQPYFSMEYVRDGNLEQRLSTGLIPPPEVAQILRSLAEAMHHAHSCGVVHRDLKPANVLLRRKPLGSSGEAGEESLEPLVSDFGLAKLLDEEGPTRTDAVLGTPQYLAPEQAEGRSREVGAQTDVYALGVILYEMLAGRPPFLGASTLEVLDQIRSTDPLPPSRVQPRIPPELEVICLKCLAREPSRRYATAADLADDLGRYLRGEPIHARRTPTWLRVSRWIRRKPVLASLSALSLGAVTALLGMWLAFTYQLQAAAVQLQKERDEARRQRVLADEGRQRAETEKTRAGHLLMLCTNAIDEHAKATEKSRNVKESTGELGSIPFVVACFYAASARVYRNDTQLPEADRERFAERYAARAVELLNRAADHRYFTSADNRQRLQTDTDLAALHGRADFRALLARVGIQKLNPPPGSPSSAPASDH